MLMPEHVRVIFAYTLHGDTRETTVELSVHRGKLIEVAPPQGYPKGRGESLREAIVDYLRQEEDQSNA